MLQYEVAFQNGLDCGGGYVKLLSSAKDLDLRQLTDKTPYTIMFGPDKCGSDSKFHLIFRHVHPETGAVEEKHCKKVEGKGRGVLEEIFKDKKVGTDLRKDKNLPGLKIMRIVSDVEYDVLRRTC